MFYRCILFQWLKSIIQYVSTLMPVVQINLVFSMG